MIGLTWIENDITGEKRLYFRALRWRIDASGAVNVMPPEWGPWQEVETIGLDESAWHDVQESGGLFREALRGEVE